MDQERDIEKRLREFPSYIECCNHVETYPRKKIEQIIERVLPDLLTHNTDVERHRDLNLVAFLYHVLDRTTEAWNSIDKSQAINNSNINTIVLKGWFHLRSKDVFEGKKVVDSQLKDMLDNQTLIVHAKAEVAYIYTRLGVELYEKAEERFKSLLDEIEQNEIAVEPDAIMIWKFGLALIMKRTLNVNNLSLTNTIDTRIEKIKQIFKSFKDISESQYEIDNKYKARALIEMGDMIHVAKLEMSKKAPVNDDLELFAQKPIFYCEKALELSNTDPFVLQRCGKQYRYTNDIDKSIELLKKAIDIKPSSYAHHHLALSLKKKIQKGQSRQSAGTSHRIRLASQPGYDSNHSYSSHPSDESKAMVSEGAVGGVGHKSTFGTGKSSYSDLLYGFKQLDVSSDDIDHSQATHHQKDNMFTTDMDTGPCNNMARRASSARGGTNRGSYQSGSNRRPYNNCNRGFGGQTFNYHRGNYDANRGYGGQTFNYHRGNYDANRGYGGQTFNYHRGNYDANRGFGGQTFNYHCGNYDANSGYGGQTFNYRRGNYDANRGFGGQTFNYHWENYDANRGYGRRTFNNRRGFNQQHQNRRRKSNYTDQVSNANQDKPAKMLQKLVKSPRKVPVIDGDDVESMNEMMNHFDKAVELGGNMAALYDKGLTVRALQRYDEAIGVFSRLISSSERPSPVYLANAYEQKALCMKEKLSGLQESEIDETTKESLEYNLKYCLNRSLEVSYSNIIEQYPILKGCWCSKDVLKDELTKKGRTKETIEELAHFHEKVQEYALSNKEFRELLDLEADTKQQEVIHKKLVENCIQLQDYDEAIVIARLKANPLVDVKVLIEIHVNGAFQSYAKGEFPLAEFRLKWAICKGCGEFEIQEEDCESSDRFHVFLFSSETNEDTARQVKNGLNNLGLEATVNFDDLGIFDTQSRGVIQVMKKSIHFIVVIETDTHADGEMWHHLEIARRICITRDYGNIIVVKKNVSVNLPVNLAHKPCIEYIENIGNMKSNDRLNPGQTAWFKELIEKLVMCN